MANTDDERPGERLSAAAPALVGVPFRMHGRDPATGLDCVGVVVAALARIGRSVTPPADYPMRGGSLHRFDRWAAGCGFAPVPSQAVPASGDVLLCAPARQHFHVMIDCGDVLVHAHIGLRKVVAVPPPVTWPVLRRWRLQAKG